MTVTIDDLKKYSIFVGTPRYGGMTHGLYTKSMVDLSAVCAKHGINLVTYFMFNESLIPRARNYIVDEFLRSGASHLLFIDADIGFKAKDVMSLLALQTHQPEYDVLCAPYTKKNIAWEKVKWAIEAGKGKTDPRELQRYTGDFVLNVLPGMKEFRIDRPIEVLESGTGFMLISRDILLKFREVYPQFQFKPNHIRNENFDGSNLITAFFDTEIDQESKRYLSEDYFFCKHVRKAGFKVHVCPWMELVHCGSFIFNSTIPALAELENVSLTSTKR